MLNIFAITAVAMCAIFIMMPLGVPDRASLAYRGLAIITIENLIFAFLIGLGIYGGAGWSDAILWVLLSQAHIALQILGLKNYLMPGVSLFESPDEFHQRLKRECND